MERRTVRKEEDGGRGLWYVDLNAVSPATAKDIAGMFEGTRVRFVDGGVCVFSSPLFDCFFLSRTEAYAKIRELMKGKYFDLRSGIPDHRRPAQGPAAG